MFMRNSKRRRSISFLLLFGLIPLGLLAFSENIQAFTYTYDADFDEGVLVGVEHQTVHDQLQLSREHTTLPFIWVPNYNGTVSKVDTDTGNELGRYRIAPPDLPLGGDPSRTTVDLQGNCWVGNRRAGTVVKIGLYEAGQYIDRNGNGIIDTSRDLNGDGDIAGAEILPWGDDECVLHEVVLIEGYQGVYVPGRYAGPYDTDKWGVAPRGLAVDAENNLWAGTWSTMKYYYIEGSTGEILQTVDVSPWVHHAYGAVIDKNGVLWSSGQMGCHVLRLDPSGDFPTISRVNMGHFVYGLGLDHLDHLFVSAWSEYWLSRIDITTGLKEWSKYKMELLEARGVACTSDNDVWVVSTSRGNVYRYGNDGNQKAVIDVGDGPTGVAVDAAGKVWVCNSGDEYIKRIDPATNAVDLEKRIVGSDGHYTYSDMTGMMSRTVTTRIGTWRVIFDSKTVYTPWETVSWTGEEPEGTCITVKVRSSNDQGTWTAWQVVSNGVSLSSIADGRYVQIEVTFQAFSADVTPILYDLTVESISPRGIPDDPVHIDIKPGSCSNPLNPESRGVLPVAILGTVDFDVEKIDPETIGLTRDGSRSSVRPIRWSFEDVARPFKGELGDCHELHGDGNTDLMLKFDTQELVSGFGLDECSGETMELTLIGSLKEEYGRTSIQGCDCVRILGEEGKQGKKGKGK